MPKRVRTAKNPFHFYTHVQLQEATGIRARNARDLVNAIKGVPLSVIYYHTHVFLQQHQFLSPEPPNDFAYWVINCLGEEELGERLGSIDISRFHTLRELREKIVEVIEGFLFDAKDIRNAPYGREFDFTKSRDFILPTQYKADNLAELADGLKKVSISSIDFHVFGARMRLERGINDFSYWIDTSLGYPQLAALLDNFDPYTYTLEGLRNKIVEIIINSPEWKSEHD